MSKNNSIKSVVEEAKKIVVKKNDEILFLKTELRKANGEKTVTFKMPDNVEVRNFPAVQKVEVQNHQQVQDVHVLNLKDIKMENKVEFPKVQQVHVLNFPEGGKEKSSKWVPDLIVHSVKAITEHISKHWSKGIEVFSSDEDKLRPQAVIVVDSRGKPVNLGQLPSVITFPGGGGTSGAPIIAESLDQYHVSDGDETGATKYYGFLTKEGYWYIMQNNTSANTYRYARGSSLYSANWANRASLSYGYFDVVF